MSPTVGAVLLAAGESQRFGEANKLLATIEGRPLVQHAARTVLESSVDDRIAVLGHDAAAVRDALPETLDTQYNDRFPEGQHTAVRAGVAAAERRGWDAAVFVLGDMPFVAPATIDALRAAFGDGRGSIIVPTDEGQRGNPVLFGAAQFDALAAVTDDQGGRSLIEAQSGVVRVAVEDPGIHYDIDRPEDLPSRT